jgi:hypothetical protein
LLLADGKYGVQANFCAQVGTTETRLVAGRCVPLHLPKLGMQYRLRKIGVHV